MGKERPKQAPYRSRMTTTTRSLTQRLKEENWDMHQVAEHGEGTGSVLRGEWGKPEYTRMIAQGYLVHRALDNAAKHAATADPRLAKLLAPEHLLAEHYAKDLAYLGLDPATVTPEPGTQRFLAHIESVQHAPLAVLGLHYVRTGASNGNRFVAKRARQAFDLPATGEGTAHLDPYGESQRAHWNAFKEELDRVELSEHEQTAVVASARKMYEYVISWHAPEHRTADQLLVLHKDRLNKAEFDQGHAVPAKH